MGSKKNTKTALRRQIESSNSKTGRGHPTQIQLDNHHPQKNFKNSRSKSPRPTKNKANNIRKMKKKTNNKKFNHKKKIFNRVLNLVWVGFEVGFGISVINHADP